MIPVPRPQSLTCYVSDNNRQTSTTSVTDVSTETVKIPLQNLLKHGIKVSEARNKLYLATSDVYLND